MSGDADFALAEACPFGKCTADVKTHIPESTDEALTMLASAHRISKSEYVRNLILDHVHGRAEVIRLRIAPPVRGVG